MDKLKDIREKLINIDNIINIRVPEHRFTWNILRINIYNIIHNFDYKIWVKILFIINYNKINSKIYNKTKNNFIKKII